MSDDKKDLEKGVREELAGLTAAGIIATAGFGIHDNIQAFKENKPPVVQELKQPVELRPELQHIAQIESSGGKNTNHARTMAGLNAGHTAAGYTGMMPLTAKETINKTPELKAKYDHLTYLPPDEITRKLNENPAIEAEIANAHWHRLDQTFGSDQARKAYAWRNGISAAMHASDDKVMNHPYVQKYLTLTGGHGVQDRYLSSVQEATKQLAKRAEEVLEKMSRPKIGFPNFPKLSTRPDADVQLIENNQQKEIYGRKVANAEMRDQDPNKKFRLHGSRTVHTKESGTAAYGKKIASKFDRNTLGLEVPTKDGPKSAAIAGKLRSKFEEGDDAYNQKVEAHNAKLKELSNQYSQARKDWYEKNRQLYAKYQGSIGDEREKARQEYHEHYDSRPKPPKKPRRPSKTRKDTTELSPEQMAKRGKAVDATVQHEAFHATMANFERHYGKEAARKVHQGLLAQYDRDTLADVGSFINRRLGYNIRGPKFTEEILAHARDILVNPHKRKVFEDFIGPDRAKEVIKKLKIGHQKAYEYAKKLKPEDIGLNSELNKTASIGHAGVNAPGSKVGGAALENKPFAQKGNAQKLKARYAKIQAAKALKEKNPKEDWEKHLALKSELAKGQNGDWKKEGYTISHTDADNEGFFQVRAHKDGKEVAAMTMRHDGPHIRGITEDETYDHEVEGLNVAAPHRRKGLATAMYQHAEKVTGKKAVPSSDRTEDAKALWSQPNRPFGKSEEMVEIPKKEFIEEHKNLVNVLNSPDHKDDLEEAKKQKKELDEQMSKALAEAEELEQIENEFKT